MGCSGECRNALDKFVAAVSEAGYPPIMYRSDEYAAFWGGRPIPERTAERALLLVVARDVMANDDLRLGRSVLEPVDDDIELAQLDVAPGVTCAWMSYDWYARNVHSPEEPGTAVEQTV